MALWHEHHVAWCCATVASNSKIFSSPQKEHLYPLSTHSPFSPLPELLATSSLNSPRYYACLFQHPGMFLEQHTALSSHTKQPGLKLLEGSNCVSLTNPLPAISSESGTYLWKLRLIFYCWLFFLPSIGFLEALLRTTMQMLRIILWGGRKDNADHREQRLRKFKLSSLLALCLCNCSSPVLKTLPPESSMLNVLAIPLLSVWLCSCVRKAKIQHTKGIHTFVFHKATWACSDTHLSLVLAGSLSVPGAFC